MTDRILPIAKEWQNRPLDRKYTFVFMDAVHFHVREDNRTIKKAVYVAIGVRLNGTREVMGMWIGGRADTEELALHALDELEETWGKKYPSSISSWKNNWPTLSTYFKYPAGIRKIIYTTNSIENFNRQLRKVTKSKTIFPTDDALFKSLYLAMMDATKKWTGTLQGWSSCLDQLVIYFEDRIQPEDIY